jgi:hypothetical protein
LKDHTGLPSFSCNTLKSLSITPGSELDDVHRTNESFL